MPIEHVARPSSSTRRRTARNAGRAASGPPAVGPTVISPATSSPASRRVGDERRHVGERAAALAGLARRVDLHQHPRPRRPAGDLGDEAAAVDGLPDVDEAGQLAHLVRLQLADEVHGERRARRPSGALVSSSWA